MRFHHVGCAVKDIESNVALYRRSFGFERVSKTFGVESQGVDVCFIEVGPTTYVEMVAPRKAGSSIDRFLQTGYYHVCYLTDNLDTTIKAFSVSFIVLSTFASEAFDGRRCAFVMTPQLHLV